jgi:hypothetical protein
MTSRLEPGQKMLPEAKWFLLDIADWIAVALVTLAELRFLQKSEIATAERLVTLVKSLGDEFQDQRNYLLSYEERLKEAGMDPKWSGNPGSQANFVARSMAGARWTLTNSSSREIIRSVNESERKDAFQKLKISTMRGWWLPEQMLWRFLPESPTESS